MSMYIGDGPIVVLSSSRSTSAASGAQPSTRRSRQAQSTAGLPTPTRFPTSNGLYVSPKSRIPQCRCSSWAILWCALYYPLHLVSLYNLRLDRFRAVHWYCRLRRVPICRRASRSCRALLRQVPVFASPSRRRVSHAGSVASHAPSFRTRTYQRPLIARYVASLFRLCFYGKPTEQPTRTIQYLSHDLDVVKENETDQLIRRSASLRAVDDMLSRVCRAF
jgi:hypothetical protein